MWSEEHNRKILFVPAPTLGNPSRKRSCTGSLSSDSPRGGADGDWRARWDGDGWWLSLLTIFGWPEGCWFPWISHVLGVHLLDSLILQVQVPVNIYLLVIIMFLWIKVLLYLWPTHSYRCLEGLIHFFMILLGCWRASTWIDQVKLRRTLLWKGHLAAWKLHDGRGHVSCATCRASMSLVCVTYNKQHHKTW